MRLSFREPLEDFPQEDELPVHGKLENWGNWCRIRQGKGSRAQSAEGMYYEAESGNIWEPQEPKILVDLISAEEVNVGLLALAEEFRFGLKLRYYNRLPDRLIFKELRQTIQIRRNGYQDFMRRARLMLNNHLRFLKIDG